MNEQSQFQDFTGNQALPNATAVLVLGILSIVTCFCYGIIGLILGIIAMYLANKDLAAYHNSPNVYSSASFNNLKAGRICAIVGLSLSALYILVIIAYIIILGATLGDMPWEQLMQDA